MLAMKIYIHADHNKKRVGSQRQRQTCLQEALGLTDMVRQINPSRLLYHPIASAHVRLTVAVTKTSIPSVQLLAPTLFITGTGDGSIGGVPRIRELQQHQEEDSADEHLPEPLNKSPETAKIIRDKLHATHVKDLVRFLWCTTLPTSPPSLPKMPGSSVCTKRSASTRSPQKPWMLRLAR
jgi:hypothetical protein